MLRDAKVIIARRVKGLKKVVRKIVLKEFRGYIITCTKDSINLFKFLRFSSKRIVRKIRTKVLVDEDPPPWNILTRISSNQLVNTLELSRKFPRVEDCITLKRIFYTTFCEILSRLLEISHFYLHFLVKIDSQNVFCIRASFLRSLEDLRILSIIPLILFAYRRKEVYIKSKKKRSLETSAHFRVISILESLRKGVLSRKEERRPRVIYLFPGKNIIYRDKNKER